MNEVEKQAREETAEYLQHIGERIHRLQILAQKCYDAVDEFNKEMEDFVETYPDIHVIDRDLRLKVIDIRAF